MNPQGAVVVQVSYVEGKTVVILSSGTATYLTRRQKLIPETTEAASLCSGFLGFEGIGRWELIALLSGGQSTREAPQMIRSSLALG